MTKETVGNLIGVPLGHVRPTEEQDWCPPDSECARLHRIIGLQCLGACKIIAAANRPTQLLPALHGQLVKIELVGNLVGVPLGKSPVVKAPATPRIVRAGKVVDIEAVGSLIGVPLGQTGRARAR
jgi:hypothetical protein